MKIREVVRKWREILRMRMEDEANHRLVKSSDHTSVSGASGTVLVDNGTVDEGCCRIFLKLLRWNVV